MTQPITAYRAEGPANPGLPGFFNSFSKDRKMIDQLLRAAALDSKAWPFEEARKLLERVKGKKHPVKEVQHETG